MIAVPKLNSAEVKARLYLLANRERDSLLAGCVAH